MKNRIFYVLLTVLALNGCTLGKMRQQLGLQRQSPDEFMVMPREKLEIPDRAIALPAPTDKVNGSVAASDEAHNAVFGNVPENNRENTELENTVLAKAGPADENIRDTVNDEYKNKTGVFGTKRGGTMEAVLDPLGYNAPKEPVVDAKKENKRIKDALAKGQKIDPDAVAKKDPRKEKYASKKNKEAEDQQPVEPVAEPSNEDLLAPSNLPVN